MSSVAMYRPKDALRRARELELVGRVNDACEYLHEVLVSKRMGRQWTKDHEDMVFKFVDLCVELRESRRCKDGLYFYRLYFQQQQPASLERVIKRLIEVSSQKAAEARARCDDAVALDSMEDLEETEQSPEALLMGGVTVDGSKERAEREILVPWIRHMWDTYRNVLDTLKNTPKLEHLYHECAIRAMLFCKAYGRATEFRKLCGMLRAHLNTQLDAGGGVLPSESIDRHMATRFSQLENCAELALWNEAFRTIEEIHDLMAIMEGVHAAAGAPASAPPYVRFAKTYYEKLARVFWVSENYLFHAYAWFKLWALTQAHPGAMTADEKRALASQVVCAALSIPIYGGQAASYNNGSGLEGSGLEVDEDRDKKSLCVLLR